MSGGDEKRVEVAFLEDFHPSVDCQQRVDRIEWTLHRVMDVRMLRREMKETESHYFDNGSETLHYYLRPARGEKCRPGGSLSRKEKSPWGDVGTTADGRLYNNNVLPYEAVDFLISAVVYLTLNGHHAFLFQPQLLMGTIRPLNRRTRIAGGG